MPTMTAEKAIERIQSNSEELKTNRPQRFPEAASPGNFFRQGDLLITVLESPPKGAKKIAFRAQLAEGSTQGSRHCLDSKSGVTMFALATPGVLDGPVLVLAKERTITHPEHGHVILPAGCYAITYQRDLDEEDRQRRVQD